MLLAGSSASNTEGDEILWIEMKEGNECAFNELFERNSSILCQYGLTIIRDRELVKDCIQELFIALWQNRKTIGSARSVRYYLLFSLRRLMLKKAGKSKLFSGPDLFQHLPGNGTGYASMTVAGHDQTLVERESAIRKQEMLSREVQSLPLRQKEIIFLRFYQGLEFKEIEGIMNLNNQTVRNTLCKALKHLRASLGKWQREMNVAVLLAPMICAAALCHFYI